MNKENPSSITPETKIGMVNSCFDKTPYEITLASALEHIQNGTWKHIVHDIRTAVNAGDKDKANKLKQQLPGFLFSGTFHRRNAEGLKRYSGIMILDFDNISQDIDALKQKIAADIFVLSVFISPSGRGIKVLVPVSITPEEHKINFEYLRMYFKAKLALELDPSGKDICRLCFASHDPYIYINWSAQRLILPAAEKAQLSSQLKSNQKTKPAAKAAKLDELTDDSRRNVVLIVLRRSIDISTLHDFLEPVVEGKRSEVFYKAVSFLRDYGCNVHEIATVLTFNSSFRDKYQGRLHAEVERVFPKLDDDDCLPAPIRCTARTQIFHMKEAGI